MIPKMNYKFKGRYIDIILLYLHVCKTMSYKVKAIFIIHITQSDLHRNETSKTSDNYLHPNVWGNWNSERLSDLLKHTQLIWRKMRCPIRFSNFGSKPGASAWKTRPSVIWPWLLFSLSYTPARYPVLWSILCLFAAVIFLPEISFRSMYTTPPFKTQAMCHIFTAPPKQGWKVLYNT